MALSHYHVFSLPSDLLDSATSLDLRDKSPLRSRTPESIATPSAASSKACNICLGATFVDVEEQRLHFRSDWHRYNVKLRLSGGNPVSESDFAQLIERLEDSLSGSASSTDESGSEESDAVATLINKTKRPSRSPSPSTPQAVPRTALVWFHSPSATQIGIYRALFTQNVAPSSYLSELRDMQTIVPEGRKWAMFMVAGGHFAGAIVRVSKAEDDEAEEVHTTKGKKKPKRPKPDTEVLRHKTFHRYTTRRKQGGSQSVNDNAKGAAKSAGALLRRYGEQALRVDIQGLITDWSEDIEQCDRIWIRASTSNRKIFLDLEGGPITKGDDRLRTFPFPTRRPTQSEISRCLGELTRVKVSHLTEEDLRAQEEAYIASLPKPRPQPSQSAAVEVEKPKVVKLTREQELYREKWIRVIEMVTKGRLEPLKAFWEREGQHLGGINATIPEWTGEHCHTLLQLASHTDQEDVVQWLLEETHADPTIELTTTGMPDDQDDGIQSDTSNAAATGNRRTAYDLARSKGVRDVFRRCAGVHSDWWDWLGAGHVPSVLSKEMQEGRDEKKKMRRKQLKERVKGREAKENETEEPPPPEEAPVIPDVKQRDAAGPRRLGGTGAGSAESVAGLSLEMRAKIERERRARAAEARLKAIGSR